MSQIKYFTGPYSSLLVATFEPLFTRWISMIALRFLQCVLSNRIVLAIPGRLELDTPLWDRVQWHPRILTTQKSIDSPEKSTVQKPWSADAIQRHAATMESLVNQHLHSPEQIIQALADRRVPFFVPFKEEEEEIQYDYIYYALSNLGIMHLYRQLHFQDEEGIGPIEQAFTVAPAETLEIIQESTIKRTHERIEEFGTETTTESEREERTQDDISNQVDSFIKRDLTVGISAHGGVNTGVYNFGANLTANIGLSTQTSRQQIQKHMTSLTRKEAEKTRNSYSLKLRTLEEVTEFSRLRRVISNTGPDPVNYGLRRVFRKINIKLQSLGPRLCWLLYLENPGLGLATSEFVLFRPSSPPVIPGVPPGAPPPPADGSATGSQVIGRPPANQKTKLTIFSDSEKDIYGLTVNQIVDVSPEGGKDVPVPPSASGIVLKTATTGKAEFEIDVDWQETKSAEVHYTYYYRPSQTARDKWQEQVDNIRKRIAEQQLEDQFNRAKKMLTEQSKVKCRPYTDLRTEERYEILGRMIQVFFGGNPGEVSPHEIEFFHRFFDINALFYYVHPSWWRPRYTKAGKRRQPYQITDESNPAPLGSSLGWLIQLDGDKRRNEFLNSPWIRVCIPFRPGVEREGVKYLAQHIVGKIGYSMLTDSELDKILKEIEDQRRLENKPLATPDYITQTGETAPPPQEALTAYPIIAEYEVVVPTEGFLYDRLEIVNP